MSNSDCSGTPNYLEGKKLSSAVPSDQLPRLREFLLKWPPLKEAFGDLLQVRVVIDANIAYGELIWRSSRRRNPAARSALHEAIVSGTIVAFAPPAIEQEIQEHIKEIAAQGKVTLDSVLKEWQQFKSLLHLYDPEPLNETDPNCPDPDDLPYKLLCEQIGAHAVYSRDAHLQKMGAPVIRVQFDLTVRDYARANTVRLSIHFGTTWSAMIGFGAFMSFVKGCQAGLQGLRKLPGWAKLIIAGGVLIVLIHPKLRAKVINLLQSARKQWSELAPGLGDALSELLTQSTLAETAAKETHKAIEALLPPRRKLSAVVRARAICLLNKEPISIKEIEARMRGEGHVSKSRNFALYLRRVIRKDKRFVEVSPGLWTVTAERAAATA